MEFTRWPVRAFAVPLLLATVIGVSAAASAGANAAPAGGSDRTAAFSGSLAGVAATSARNAWAVGYAGTAASPRTLIVRWRGTAWSKVSGPGLGASGSLAGVAATSARNAWAVGYAGTAASPRTLIVRWRGTAWSKVSGPGLGASGSLAGVAATSAENAWAVGSTGGSVHSGGKAVILHWNGTAWRSVPCPRPGTGSMLNAVTAASMSSAWAVGSYVTKADPFGKPFIAHWNGTSWKQLPFRFGFLSSVAISSRGAWAVGGTGGDGLDFPLILHWNGSAWKQAHSPATVSGGHFFGVAATSSTSAWAVGLTYGTSSKILIARWNGSAWKAVRSPSLKGSALTGVAATSVGHAWAVGYTGAPGHPATLILQWNGTTWK